MNPKFTLPEYDVVIWHKIESSHPGLHERIIDIAGKRPDESWELQGFRDMHWDFKTSHEAIAFAESLLEIAASEDVTVLCVNSTRDPNFVCKVYKDTRIFDEKKT